MTLIFLSLAWLTGIYLGSTRPVDPRIVLLVSLLPLATALLWRRDARIRLAALCLVALAAGVLRYQSALPPVDYGSIAGYVGPRPVDVGAVVVAEPDIRGKDIFLTVDTYHIGGGQDSYKVSGKIQVRVPRYSTYRYGDDLLLKGTLVEPSEDDGFDYRQYLIRQGIYAIMYYPQVTVVNKGQGNHLLAALYTVKARLQSALAAYIPEPEAGLVQGILLGVRATFSTQLSEALQRVGLTHIVVVSGYNLTVVATILLALAQKRLRRSLAMLIAITGVVLFTLMSGATPPVVRAAIMVSMALLARATGRESDALTSVLFTAALLVGFSPLTLWDVSFQLSFLATLGLVLLSPPLERALSRLPLGSGTILATTIAAQIMTLPVIALNFQRISLISPLANLLVQPAIPPMMVTGAVCAVAGLTGHVAVRLAGWLSWLLGAYTVKVMEVLGAVRYATVDLPVMKEDLQPVAVLVYFAVVALVFYVPTHVQRSHLSALWARARGAGGGAGAGSSDAPEA